MCRALSLNEMSLAALGLVCMRLAVHRAAMGDTHSRPLLYEDPLAA